MQAFYIPNHFKYQLNKDFLKSQIGYENNNVFLLEKIIFRELVQNNPLIDPTHKIYMSF